MILLAIDPGPTRSAWLAFDTASGRPGTFAISDNDDLLRLIRSEEFVARTDRVVIEQIASYGMAVGAEVFETVFWSGRFAQAAHPVPFDRVTRRAVKLTLCGSMKAKDTNIRQALIDRYGGSEAIGRKANPGPLFGVSKDVWSALAVAVTYADQLGATA